LISRIRGADAILLIVAALSDEELATMHETALSLSMDVLVEIHDENELARAMAIKPAIIGINQRDLHSFAIDTKRAIRLRSSIGTDIITVAESGINSFADMLLLGSEGFDAALVGENLVIQNDRCLAVQKLLGKQTAI
jgi:indole-3-glycerol phosphate synthase